MDLEDMVLVMATDMVDGKYYKRDITSNILFYLINVTNIFFVIINYDTKTLFIRNFDYCCSSICLHRKSLIYNKVISDIVSYL